MAELGVGSKGCSYLLIEGHFNIDLSKWYRLEWRHLMKQLLICFIQPAQTSPHPLGLLLNDQKCHAGDWPSGCHSSKWTGQHAITNIWHLQRWCRVDSCLPGDWCPLAEPVILMSRNLRLFHGGPIYSKEDKASQNSGLVALDKILKYCSNRLNAPGCPEQRYSEVQVFFSTWAVSWVNKTAWSSPSLPLYVIYVPFKMVWGKELGMSYGYLVMRSVCVFLSAWWENVISQRLKKN